jgi:hypothetical protein
MRFHQIISEAPVAGSTFTLAPGLNPEHYAITDSMGDIEKWKAMTFDGDGTIKKGTMAPVGYVWISLKDNTIIPISKGDEHHEGGDMVYGMIERGKWKFNARHYQPFYGRGTNYIYYREDAPKWVATIQKFLAWGGRNGVMKGANGESGVFLNYRQFVENNGTITLTTGQLNPMGKHFYDLHKALQDAILAAHGADKPMVVMKPFKIAAEIIKFLSELSYHVPAEGLGTDRMKAFVKQVREATKERNVQVLSELMFGFESPKRAFHEKIRHTEPKDWDYAKVQGFWGDVEYAENLLAHL